jgi:hypothetical protein
MVQLCHSKVFCVLLLCSPFAIQVLALVFAFQLVKHVCTSSEVDLFYARLLLYMRMQLRKNTPHHFRTLSYNDATANDQKELLDTLTERQVLAFIIVAPCFHVCRPSLARVF